MTYLVISNLRLAKTNLGKDINNILNTEDLENIQNHLNSLKSLQLIILEI